MAISRVTTWSAGQVLTASDLNGEFNNILNNALNLISPLTGNLNANSKQITNLLLEVQASSQTAANEGRVYYQSTEDQVHVDDGTNIRRVPTIASVTRGDVIVASANNQWSRVAIGANTRVLASDGTDAAWTALAHGTHLSGVGTNTHAQLDTHTTASSNTHGIGSSSSLIGNRSTTTLEHLQRGSVAIGTTGSSDRALYETSAAVTFGVAYSSVSAVVLGGLTQNSTTVAATGSRNVSTTGMTITALGPTTTDLGTAYWVALGAL